MSDLENRIASHLWQLAPLVKSRTTARLLEEALEEIKAHNAALTGMQKGTNDTGRTNRRRAR